MSKSNFNLNSIYLFKYVKFSKDFFFKLFILLTTCFPISSRVHEFSDNPTMKFLVKVKVNNIEVSRGYGKNKKSAKYAAVQILL